MNEQEAVARVEEWLRTHPDGDRTTGPAALRIRPEYTARRGEGWVFTVNAAGFLDGTDPGRGLVPSPVLFVPDDGGEVVVDQALTALGASSDEEGFVEWRPDVDPEFDTAKFGAAPARAIRGWRQYTFWDEPTGSYRANDEYRPGPLWRGYPRPHTDAQTLMSYLGNGWLAPADFARLLLDREIIVPAVDGKPLTSRDGTSLFAYTSSANVPQRYPKWWRVTLRELLAGRKPGELVLDSGTGMATVVKGDLLGPVEGPSTLDDLPTESAPEVSPAVAEAASTLAKEFGLEPSRLSDELRRAGGRARAYFFELTPEECLSFLRALAWYSSPEKDLPAVPGLVMGVGKGGQPAPKPWTFGKFYLHNTPPSDYAWHRLVGAYVGFAIGDALGAGAAGPLPLGGLTRQLLLNTEAVLRGIPSLSETGEVPASLPSTDPDGWLSRATAHAGPAPAEFSALLAAALPAATAGGTEYATHDEGLTQGIARELVGSGAGDEVAQGVKLLVSLFHRLLDKREFVLPTHLQLEELGGELATATLALREDRDADDVTQFDSIGDGRSPLSVLGRALFAAAKRGYDPEVAIALAARGGSVAGALTGALLGAQLGVPGLPAAWVAALPDLGLLDDLASDAFFHFNRNGIPVELDSRPRWEQRYPNGQFAAEPAGLSLRSRLRGSLLAGAIGDALGAKTEFDSIDRIREIAGPAGITDFIPAYGGVGRITDDTQMTLFTLEGLIRAHAQQRRTGSADVVQSLQMAYQRWLHTQGVPWDRARGPQSELAEPDGWLLTHQELFSRRAPGLTCFGELETYGRAGIRGTTERQVNNSKGCGGVMRAAPVALWSDDLAEVFKLGADSAALTHGHPSGYLSSGAFAVIMHELLHGKPLLDAVATARLELEKYPGHEEQTAAFDAALALAEQGPPTPEKLESLGGGNVGETALSMSVYVALTTPDVDSALLASVNHSGDSDSTGSVCGNLVGAMYGEEALRASWLDRLELREVIGELADDALVEFGPDAPSDDRWFARYPVD